VQALGTCRSKNSGHTSSHLIEEVIVKVLVIGATGTIGKAVVNALVPGIK